MMIYGERVGSVGKYDVCSVREKHSTTKKSRTHPQSVLALSSPLESLW